MTDDTDDLVPAVPLRVEPAETWLEREARELAERQARERAERDELGRRSDAAIARVRALASGNGAGFCRFCGVKFTADDEGRAMHPANDCAGPKPANCPECGRAPALIRRGQFRVWELPCGPADHAAARGQTNPTTNVDIQRPTRVGNDEDEA